MNYTNFAYCIEISLPLFKYPKKSESEQIGHLRTFVHRKEYNCQLKYLAQKFLTSRSVKMHHSFVISIQVSYISLTNKDN